MKIMFVGDVVGRNGRKAFREAMLAGRWDDCVDVARKQTAAPPSLGTIATVFSVRA